MTKKIIFNKRREMWCDSWQWSRFVTLSDKTIFCALEVRLPFYLYELWISIAHIFQRQNKYSSNHHWKKD